MNTMIALAALVSMTTGNAAISHTSAGGHYEWRQTGNGPRSGVTTRVWVPDPSSTRSGHYEWRSVPQFGPRSNGPARARIWVPDAAPIERQ